MEVSNKSGRPYESMKILYDEHQIKSNFKCVCSKCVKTKNNLDKINRYLEKNDRQINTDSTREDSNNCSKPNTIVKFLNKGKEKDHKESVVERVDSEFINTSNRNYIQPNRINLTNQITERIEIINLVDNPSLEMSEGRVPINTIDSTYIQSNSEHLTNQTSEKNKIVNSVDNSGLETSKEIVLTSTRDSDYKQTNRGNLTNQISEKSIFFNSVDNSGLEMSEEMVLGHKLEAIANGRVLIFTGDKLHEYYGKQHFELVGTVQQIVSGIQLKGITVTKIDNGFELTIVAFDDLDYITLIDTKLHSKLFGGIKLKPLKSKLFIHITIKKSLNIDPALDSSLANELKAQGIEKITKDKNNDSNVSTRAMVEVNSVEKWYNILENGLTISKIHHIAKRWKFTSKFCKKCHRYRHTTGKCKQSNEMQRCSTCAVIHKGNEICSKMIKCFNCRSNEHKSGSNNCPVWIEEERRCNSSYEEMLASKKPQTSKYNTRAEVSSGVSSKVFSVSSSASNQANSTMMRLIQNIQEEQVKLDKRMTSVELDVSEVKKVVGDTIKSEFEKFKIESSLRNKQDLMEVLANFQKI